MCSRASVWVRKTMFNSYCQTKGGVMYHEDDDDGDDHNESDLDDGKKRTHFVRGCSSRSKGIGFSELRGEIRVKPQTAGGRR